MKTYFYTFNRHHHRTFEIIGITCGVIFAKSIEEAERKVIELYFNDYSSYLTVSEVYQEEGYQYTCYKSQMN